ncbi:MAG: transglutaminase-like domain-containing protein [Planctomycetes bacterium]|nr:transglutaminase-like domain-containing protein [Planctomycetota bacterium]
MHRRWGRETGSRRVSRCAWFVLAAACTATSTERAPEVVAAGPEAIAVSPGAADASVTELSWADWARAHTHDVWLEYSLDDAPLGWYLDRWRVEPAERPTTLVVERETRVRAYFANELSQTRLRAVARFDLEQRGRLTSFEHFVDQDGVESTKVLRVADGRWRVFVGDENGRVEREGPSGEVDDLLDSIRAYFDWIEHAPAVGERRTYAWLDLHEPILRPTTTAEYLERLEGDPSVSHRLRVEELGLVGECDLDAAGQIVRGVGPAGVRVERCGPEIAERRLEDPPEFDRLSQLPVDVDFGESDDVDRLVLEFSQLGGAVWPETARQRVLLVGEDRVVVQTRRGVEEPPRELSTEERERYTRCDHRFDCDAPAIRRLATRAVAGKSTPRSRIRALLDATRRELTGSGAANASRASAVLERGRGDCTEFTLLFIAPARANGLPARELAGIVWTGPGSRAFGWHAWAAVHDGQRWVEVDPVFGQLPVDATHVATELDFGSGAPVPLLSNLVVRVLRFD